MKLKLFNIPFAIGLTIDDMGWWLSKDEKDAGGPPRLHGEQDPKPEFYKSIIEMAKTCGTRPQGSFILSEFDKNNICAKPKYNKPEAIIDITEKGLDWTNEISDEQAKCLDLVKEENAWLEFGLHGVRHGHFVNKEFYISEWAKRPKRDENDNIIDEDKTVVPWDEKNETSQVIVDCYIELMRQYYTEEELDFPESFAPPHHALFYEENNDYTTGAILSKKGVKYSNAKLSGYKHLECPIPRSGVVDHGMHILDRRSIKGTNFELAGENPICFPRHFPWIESHFRDFWYTERNWAVYLYKINSLRKKMLAKNTEQVHSQYVYNKYAKIINLPNKVIIDTRNIPDEFYENDLLSSLVIKVPLGRKYHIKINEMKGDFSLCGYYKDIYGNGYLYLGSKEGRLKKGVYSFTYSLSKLEEGEYVINTFNTFNLYNFEHGEDTSKLTLKLYGEQLIRIRTFNPKKIDSNLEILYYIYEEDHLYIRVKAKSMNGDTGYITWSK